MIERLRRLPTAAPAMRAGRLLKAHDAWSVEELRAHRRKLLLETVRHAAAESPFYRERFAGIELSEDLDLQELPTLDKTTMLEHFDELVTDRRLTRSVVEAHLGELERADRLADPKLFGEYRTVASGGTSGRRGVFVYGRSDWVASLAGLARCWSAYFDFAPSLPRRRFATITADRPLHMSARWNRSTDIGAHRMLKLDVGAPIDELTRPLNSFRPQGLSSYPSVISLLAEKQLSGELRISPKMIAVSGEVLTDASRERIEAAFGQAPFNYYGSSEAPFTAADCSKHAGLHVFEDQVHIEVVDDANRPVPAGQQGGRLLITNLYNRTQPLIRYELNDLVARSSDRCPCGRPFPLLESVDGRKDDVLEMPGVAGETIKVHPLTLRSPLAGISALSAYRVVFGRGEGLRVDAVLNERGDREEVCRHIEARLEAALSKRGVRPLPIRARSVDEIPMDPQSGKRKAIEVAPRR